MLAPGHLLVAWCPFPLFRPLGPVISFVIRYVVLNTGLLFISLFVALCVKLDTGTYKGNASRFGLKIGCDNACCMSYLGLTTVVEPLNVVWMGVSTCR
jgi:hypothetical protein